MESAAAASPVSVEAQLAEMRTMMATLVTAQAAPQQAPARKVRDLWQEYLRSFPGAAPKWARRTTWYITDLTFVFEGETISLADQPWTRLTPQMGHAWWREMRATEKDNPKDPDDTLLSAAYCNRLRTAISGCFSYHVKQADRADSRVRSDLLVDNITENPIRRWPRASRDEEGKRIGGFEDEAQLAAFLSHAHPLLVEMATMSVWCGGMRKNEVRELRFSFINFPAKTITLPGWHTKSGKDRTFPVTPACMQILERRLATRRSEFVFPAPGSVKGTPVCVSTLENWVREARRLWGVQLNGSEEVVFHHFRHTFAKWSLLLGDPATLVMEYGGWMTFDVFKGYAKANAAMIEQSRVNKTQSIREAIDKAGGKPATPAHRRSAHRASRNEIRAREATK